MEKPVNHTEFNAKELIIKVIPRDVARQYILRYHYMGTMPNSLVCFGVFYQGELSGCIAYGCTENTGTKIRKILPNLKDGEFIEMQRMHIKDICGKNSESFALGRTLRLLKAKGIKAVITHSGGCKNDCGIVYQSSNWLYFGKVKCRDFYHTTAGRYESLAPVLRYGKVPNAIKRQGHQKVGEYVFGPGEVVDSYRYTYVFPTQKEIRAELEEKCQPYPKDSARFRKDGEWCDA